MSTTHRAAPTMPTIPWIWFILVGAACTVLGIIGVADLSMAYALTFYSVVLFGILFTIAGAAQIVGGFFVRPWISAVLQILCGILYVVAGGFAITEPGLAATIYTLLLAIALMLALGGVITMMVGVFVIQRWPWDSTWVIGLFFAIDLIFQGISWLAMGVNLRLLDRAIRAGVHVEIK